MTLSDGVSPSPKGGPEPARPPSKSATVNSDVLNVSRSAFIASWNTAMTDSSSVRRSSTLEEDNDKRFVSNVKGKRVENNISNQTIHAQNHTRPETNGKQVTKTSNERTEIYFGGKVERNITTKRKRTYRTWQCYANRSAHKITHPHTTGGYLAHNWLILIFVNWQ